MTCKHTEPLPKDVVFTATAGVWECPWCKIDRLEAMLADAKGILSHNMALANATARRALDERNGIIRNMREKYSAIEIADMVGLTRQRVHQILNEGIADSATGAKK